MANSDAEYEKALESLARLIVTLARAGDPAHTLHLLQRIEQEYPEGGKARAALEATRHRVAATDASSVLPGTPQPSRTKPEEVGTNRKNPLPDPSAPLGMTPGRSFRL